MTPPPLLPTTPQKTLKGKLAERKALFDKYFTDFQGDIGSTVCFKHSGRNKTEWTVVNVETDFQACRWSKGGKAPLFIELEREVILAGDKRKTERVWTCTNQLVNNGAKARTKK